jgi:hypothetical protein
LKLKKGLKNGARSFVAKYCYWFTGLSTFFCVHDFVATKNAKFLEI